MIYKLRINIPCKLISIHLVLFRGWGHGSVWVLLLSSQFWQLSIRGRHGAMVLNFLYCDTKWRISITSTPANPTRYKCVRKRMGGLPRAVPGCWSLEGAIFPQQLFFFSGSYHITVALTLLLVLSATDLGKSRLSTHRSQGFM